MADAAAGVGSIEGDGDESCCVAGAKGERSHMYHTHEMVIVAKECERGPTLESQAGDGRADNEKQPASKQGDPRAVYVHREPLPELDAERPRQGSDCARPD